MNEAERSRHRVRGGVILDSLKDQALRDAGLVEGFVLLRIDGKPVSTTDELHAALQGARERGERGVLVEGVHPNGQTMHVGIPISR
jgi:S1-C subfamily serine protease